MLVFADLCPELQVVMADFHLPDSLSPDARDLICRLLQKNPAERIPLQEIPAHNWVRGPAQQVRTAVYPHLISELL